MLRCVLKGQGYVAFPRGRLRRRWEGRGGRNMIGVEAGVGVGVGVEVEVEVRL